MGSLNQPGERAFRPEQSNHLGSSELGDFTADRRVLPIAPSTKACTRMQSRAMSTSRSSQRAREKCSWMTRQLLPWRAKKCVPRPRTFRPLPSPTVQ